jgi:hypothetical protein
MHVTCQLNRLQDGAAKGTLLLQLMDRRWGCKRKICFSMQAVSLKNNGYIHDFFIYWTCESNQSLSNLQDYFNTEQAKKSIPLGRILFSRLN